MILFLGNNWNDIKNLQARYKVRIEISQMFEGGDRMVSITGHKNNVELAEAQVAWMTSRDSCHDGADEFDTSLEETIRKLEQMKMQLESDEKAYDKGEGVGTAKNAKVAFSLRIANDNTTQNWFQEYHDEHGNQEGEDG
uniref:KH_dom_type_1 domain-containing protein n=1 Tax=Angiostrongylus cantonensis TaxID=6313 RepID=A0A0K0CT02_ANGCA